MYLATLSFSLSTFEFLRFIRRLLTIFSQDFSQIFEVNFLAAFEDAASDGTKRQWFSFFVTKILCVGVLQLKN